MIAGYAFADPLLRGLGATDETMSYALDYLPPLAVGYSADDDYPRAGRHAPRLQDTVTPLKVATVGTLVNIVLNWLLIYPVGWGVAGSATGTSLTQWGMAAALGVVMMRGTREHAVPWAPDTTGMRSVLSLGSWLMLRTLSMCIASLLTVFVVARFGTEHTAAYQLGMGVFNLFLYALDSLAIAAQALLGKELGERDLNVESERAKVRQLKNRLLRMSLIYGVITGLICPLIGFCGSWIFTKDAQVAFLFTIATVIIALGQPIAAYVFTLDGILMGAQDVKYLAIGCFIMLVMYVPVMLGLHWGGRQRHHGCARRGIAACGRLIFCTSRESARSFSVAAPARMCG